MKCDFCCAEASLYIYMVFSDATFPQDVILACEKHAEEAYVLAEHIKECE